ncbi:hypothetical protein RRG08_015379 [Elysia crispata]|uniref:Uncharacterized protein n=1 Tax=Elysia crispata TaxID=231223 RepID=A0AAE0YSE3_9GAST|nr:hypothetical protein RRG08_015379 [Elysia crispata]
MGSAPVCCTLVLGNFQVPAGWDINHPWLGLACEALLETGPAPRPCDQLPHSLLVRHAAGRCDSPLEPVTGLEDSISTSFT